MNSERIISGYTLGSVWIANRNSKFHGTEFEITHVKIAGQKSGHGGTPIIIFKPCVGGETSELLQDAFLYDFDQKVERETIVNPQPANINQCRGSCCKKKTRNAPKGVLWIEQLWSEENVPRSPTHYVRCPHFQWYAYIGTTASLAVCKWNENNPK